jgi:hypothetical protein
MKKFRFLLILVILIISKTICLNAQAVPVKICSTYVNYATAYSNGHKIANCGSAPSDIIFVVYNYKADTIHFAFSNDGGENWQSQTFWATLWGNAHFPSLDVYDNSPWIVSEGDSFGLGEIFLMNPFTWSFPERISHTPGHSTLPAIAIDTFGNKHIVWQDSTPGNWDIYYTPVSSSGDVGDILNLSNDSLASDIYPSISIFNGNEVHVIWERYETLCESPYSIFHRYLSNDLWSDEEFLAGPTYLPLHHPSLDFSHGDDSLSAAWEDSSAGKSDAYFHGGNGGNLPTTGNSKYPVISTMGNIWSYLYWEDNSDGVDDIYAHTYYFMSGWSSYKFREAFINEDMRHPSVADCYVIWTQGDFPPYKVMFAYEGLPCGVEEPETPASLELKGFPNPFMENIIINIPSSTKENFQLKVYDITGTLIQELPKNQKTWDGRNSKGKAAKSGIYILKIDGFKPLKVIKLL